MKQNVNNEKDLEIVDVTQMPPVSTDSFDFDLQAATSAERIEKAMQTTAAATSVIAQDTLERAGRSQKLEGALHLIALGTSVITLAIIAYLAYLVRDTLSLLVFSFLIAYVLSPIVNFFEHRGVNRLLVVAGLSIVILGILIFTALVIIDWATAQLTTFKTDLPEMTETLKVKIAEWESKLKETVPQLESLKLSEKLTIENIQNWISSRIENTISFISGISSKIMPFVSILVIVPFMTFFMLSGGESAKKKFIEIMPNRYFETTLILINELDRQLGQYLRSRVLETVVLSAIGIIGFAALRIRFYVFLGILAGVANIIPYIEPVLGAIPACVIGLIYPPFGGWSVPLVIA
ncbi:AI-2E family transporter, partial [bacterium]|nr:AI-2E family transporter [bacterium]